MKNIPYVFWYFAGLGVLLFGVFAGGALMIWAGGHA